MGVFGRLFNRNREPTDPPTSESVVKMVTTTGESYYSWNGNLYESDIVRACIRPKVKAIGKLTAKHIREDANGLVLFPSPNIRVILQYPNKYMTFQQMLEKMATQLCLNNNAFALVMRNQKGMVTGIYPISCTTAEARWDGQNLYIRFTCRNGNCVTFPYDNVLHLRQDYNTHDIFGSSPAPALAELMECVGVIDQGIVKAIKNSGVIKWLLTFDRSMRPEDVKKNVKEFVDNYLSYESETFGAAGIDAKATAKQIEPQDYVPNAAQTDRITDRIYSFFNINKNIVQSNWTEEQWTAYYEAEVAPVAQQLSECLTRLLFTQKSLGFGNRIVFEANDFRYASFKTKLSLTQFFDRGIMNANEIRSTLNLSPTENGDMYYVRLDTAPQTAATDDEKGGEDDED